MKQIISIDPDLHRSGIAIFEDNKLIFLECMYLWNLFNYLDKICVGNYIVLLEAGHLSKANWHGGLMGAKNMGKGQAIGIILQEYMEHKNINHRLIPVNGYSKKFKDKEFFKLQTGWIKNTNDDMRAAASIGFYNK